jgi:hypothetical protein
MSQHHETQRSPIGLVSPPQEQLLDEDGQCAQVDEQANAGR